MPLGEMFIDWCDYGALTDDFEQQVVNDKRHKYEASQTSVENMPRLHAAPSFSRESPDIPKW